MNYFLYFVVYDLLFMNLQNSQRGPDWEIPISVMDDGFKILCIATICFLICIAIETWEILMQKVHKRVLVVDIWVALLAWKILLTEWQWSPCNFSVGEPFTQYICQHIFYIGSIVSGGILILFYTLGKKYKYPRAQKMHK